MGIMSDFITNLKIYKDISTITENGTVKTPFTISRSSYETGYDCELAFDDKENTSWCCANYETSPWIKIDFGEKVSARAVAIQAPHNYTSVNGLEQSVRDCKIQISNDDSTWQTIYEVGTEIYEKNVPKIFEFDKNYEFRYLRIYKENNTLKYLAISEMRVLQLQQLYLIYDQGVYKTYDESTNSLVTVSGADVINSSNAIDVCITDLLKIIPFLNELEDDFKIITNQKATIVVEGIKNKNSSELITMNNDFPTTIHSNIDYFENQAEITGNGEIKIVFSIDEGVTWKTHDGTEFIDLPVTIPCKPYNELTEEELIQWNNARDEILANGIDSDTLKTLDFNTLTFDKIRFAYVLHVEDVEDTVLNKKLTWQFDAKGSMKLMKDDEIDIEVLPTGIKVTPKVDSSLIKLNIVTDDGKNGSSEDNLNFATRQDILELF